MVATGVAATAFFQLYKDGGVNALQWIQVSGTLSARTLINGVPTTVYSVAWNASTYKYLRISESGGNIQFDSSTNGTSWTNRAAPVNPFAVTDLLVDFGATCGNVASPGSFRLDDINLILPALTTAWNWTQVVWSLANRYKVVTLAIDAAGTAQGYVATSDAVDVSGNPAAPVRWWSGPADGGRLLTEQTSQASAEAMAVNLPLDGRFDLPEMVEARCVRVYHRSIDGAAYTVRELYPRRLVQADDIEAESIRALHIAAASITGDRIVAGTITADLITVTELSAITANMGTITAGTITGATIQTATSGARVVLSSAAAGGLIGYSGSDTYDPAAGTGTYQVLWKKTDGKLYAGGGKVVLDAAGIGLEVGAASVSQSQVTWFHPSSAGFSVALGATHDTGVGNASAYWTAEAHSGNDAGFVINAFDSIGGLRAGLQISGSSQLVRVNVANFEVASGDATIVGGLNVGTATGAPDGVIITQITDAVTAGVTNALFIRHVSTGTPAANFGLATYWQLETSTHVMNSALQLNVQWATATNGSQKARANFFIHDTAARLALTMEGSGSAPMIGFLGAAAITRPAVGAAAPAGGTGVAAGGWSSAANRDTAIAVINAIRTAGINLGLWSA
jgi:hypothetical protein